MAQQKNILQNALLKVNKEYLIPNSSGGYNSISSEEEDNEMKDANYEMEGTKTKQKTPKQFEDNSMEEEDQVLFFNETVSDKDIKVTDNSRNKSRKTKARLRNVVNTEIVEEKIKKRSLTQFKITKDQVTEIKKEQEQQQSEKEDISDEKTLIPEDPQTIETTSVVQVSNEEFEKLINENIFGVEKPKKKVPLFSQKKDNTKIPFIYNPKTSVMHQTHYAGKMDCECPKCGAMLFKSEIKKTKTGELKSSICCCAGKHVTAKIVVPKELEEKVFNNQTVKYLYNQYSREANIMLKAANMCTKRAIDATKGKQAKGTMGKGMRAYEGSYVQLRGATSHFIPKPMEDQITGVDGLIGGVDAIINDPITNILMGNGKDEDLSEIPKNTNPFGDGEKRKAKTKKQKPEEIESDDEFNHDQITERLIQNKLEKEEKLKEQLKKSWITSLTFKILEWKNIEKNCLKKEKVTTKFEDCRESFSTLSRNITSLQ